MAIILSVSLTLQLATAKKGEKEVKFAWRRKAASKVGEYEEKEIK